MVFSSLASCSSCSILLQLLAFLPRFFLLKTRRTHHDSTSFPLIQMLLPILHSQLSFVMCRSRLTDQPDPLLPDYFLPTRLSYKIEAHFQNPHFPMPLQLWKHVHHRLNCTRLK